MADSDAQSNGNGNGNGNGDSKRVYDEMTRYEVVDLLIREISRVVDGAKEELREDLGGRIDNVENSLGNRMDKLETEMGSLHMAVHQNQITFMKNHEDLDKRVEVLEGKA